MKRSIVILVAVILILIHCSACGKSASPNVTTKETISTDVQPAVTVNETVWEQTFSEAGLLVLLDNYTVTNLLEEGCWETSVTTGRVSRLSKTNSGELVAGAILTNGDNGVVQYVYHKETGWEQGLYGETDTVEQYTLEITQELIDTLLLLSGEYANADWDEEQAAYVINLEIPYDGPALADPSQEKPTVLRFEVFFTDGQLIKINTIDGESVSVIHDFGSTQVPQLPDE